MNINDQPPDLFVYAVQQIKFIPVPRLAKSVSGSYVFGPPGSGSESVIICTDHNQAKKQQKNGLYCWDFFMTLKNDVNVLQKVKKVREKNIFLLIS